MYATPANDRFRTAEAEAPENPQQFRSGFQSFPTAPRTLQLQAKKPVTAGSGGLTRNRPKTAVLTHPSRGLYVVSRIGTVTKNRILIHRS